MKCNKADEKSQLTRCDNLNLNRVWTIIVKHRIEKMKSYWYTSINPYAARTDSYLFFFVLNYAVIGGGFDGIFIF